MPQAGLLDVFYEPSAARLDHAGLSSSPEKRRVRLLQINGEKHLTTIFPVNTLGVGKDFLQPKYRKVQRITLDGTASLDANIDFSIAPTTEEVVWLLESLPIGFVKDFDFGLGFTKEHRFILSAVERLSDCSEIFISHDHKTAIDDDSGVFFLRQSDYNRLRKECNRFTQQARTTALIAKVGATYNYLAFRLGRAQQPFKLPQGASVQNVSDREVMRLMDEGQQDDAVSALSRSARTLAKARPEKVAKLRDDIELVALEVLIERFEEMLSRRLTEARWQAFFNANPFLLNLAFGYPLIKIQDQASVGGRTLSGGGEKIADFLMKNAITNNVAIVEIKTPHANLLNKKAIRGGVFTPSAELTGALTQVLDQKFKLEGEIATLARSSRVSAIETYSVHCCVIIGRSLSEPDHHKCFEIFRRNSKAVEVVTFDELLMKLRGLRDLLRGEGANG